MRSRNSNFKTKGIAQDVLRGAGFVSVGVLTLLGITAISPITNRADAANGWDEELKNYRESASTVTLSMDSGTNSVVNAGNTNTNVGVVKRTASVTLGNTNGYSVYIRANSANLTGSNSSNTIPSVTSNSTLSQMTDKWGWNGGVGDSITDCSLSDVFKQMTTSNQTLGTGGAVSSGTKKVTMCFGTRVSEAKVADTYSNTVTLSVVAQPGRTATFNGITTMQQMTSTICSAANYHETAQLEDTRDGKKYWVTKMLDGNCWMSQNLALDLSTSKALTSADSDVASSWTPGHNTESDTKTGDQTGTGTYSWNRGHYVVAYPTGEGTLKDVDGWTASIAPNFYKENAGSPVNSSTNTYDAHYLAGNYYQWNAATAGTGGTITNANAPSSICPKNWKLPNANSDAKGTFKYLFQQYGITTQFTGTSSLNSNTYDIALLPLFFVRGGWVIPGSGSTNGGRNAFYWSSRAGSNSSIAYVFTIDYSHINSSSYDSRYDGQSVRCLVQTP